MQAWLIKLDEVAPQKLFWWIVSFSIGLAAWIQYIQHGWINPDSVLYFEQARLISLGDWRGAVAVFNWPFYGICIALVHKFTTLSIHTSAQILNVVFFGAATASYLRLIQLIGGTSCAMICGALILFGSQYIVGDVLGMLLRDEGFWTFFLASMVFLIQYLQQHKIRDAVIWQVSIIIATLFRIEAICYLLGLPIAFFFLSKEPWQNRLRHIVYTYSVSLFIIAVIFMTLLLNPDLSMKNFGRLQEVFSLNLYNEFTANLKEKAKVMADQVLGKFLNEFAIPGLLITFIYAILIKIISSAGIIPCALNLYGMQRRLHNALEKNAYFVLRATALIAIISMALIITKVFVLSGRYVVAFSWILMIFAALYYAELLQSTNKKHLFSAIFIAILLSLGLVKNIWPKREGYNYMQDAAAWLQQKNINNNSVFYDDSRMRYASGAPFVGTWGDNRNYFLQTIPKNIHINKYNYLVISSNKKHPETINYIQKYLLQYKCVATFYNPQKTKGIFIYQLQNK